MAAVVCLGEALIDFVADEPGLSLMDCPGFRKAAGGAPANVAVGVARLGGSAAFVGRVGEDPFGRFLERTFREAGVDTGAMTFDPEARTGLAFVALLPGGVPEYTFFRHPSADMRLAAEHLPDDLFEGARVFHFGSITLIGEPSRTATLEAARRARAGGCLVTFDPNLRFGLWPSREDARAQALAALPAADLVKVSEEEAVFLTGEADPIAAARQLLRTGPQVVCITSGQAGSLCVTGSATVHVPSFPVEVVDTTGAGDGFVAGLLFQVLADGERVPLPDRDWGAAARFANAVAALACTRKGAIPALPEHPAVEVLLASCPEAAS